jgi:cytochrome c biogenesis protein CcmG, thiol:disulfide interchange protein DsbE
VKAETVGSNRAGLLIVGAGLLVGLAAGLLIFVGLPSQWPWRRAAPVAATSGPLATPAPAAVTGAPAPDFTLTTLTGQSVKLSGLKGQVVLINFWATWCGPCRQEMPAIQHAYDARKSRGLIVLAVNLNEPPKDVQAYVDSLHLSFPVLLDSSEAVSNLYRVRGYPTSFFVDRQGVVAVEQVGEMTDAQLAANLAKVGLGD